MAELQPEVAARYELTTATTRLHVQRLGQDVDLTQVTLAEADALMALPGGFEWLRRKPAPELPVNSAGPAADTAGPARAKNKKTGARGGA